RGAGWKPRRRDPLPGHCHFRARHDRAVVAAGRLRDCLSREVLSLIPPEPDCSDPARVSPALALPMTRAHMMWRLCVAVAFPSAFGLQGAGGLGGPMFSKSDTVRLRLVAIDAWGARHSMNPSALAARAGPSGAVYLAGADHFRHDPVGRTFRYPLAEV